MWICDFLNIPGQMFNWGWWTKGQTRMAGDISFIPSRIRWRPLCLFFSTHPLLPFYLPASQCQLSYLQNSLIWIADGMKVKQEKSPVSAALKQISDPTISEPSLRSGGEGRDCQHKTGSGEGSLSPYPDICFSAMMGKGTITPRPRLFSILF